MKFKFKYRRRFFWKTFTVSGHRYDENQNKMVLYFENGSVREIKDWRNCEVKLGIDWALETKKQMEKESGVEIK